jgi:hypothetical protein
MQEMLTPIEAFESMRSFLTQFNEREASEAIEMLLGWTEIAGDGATCDPAQWSDWESSVIDARSRLASGQLDG